MNDIGISDDIGTSDLLILNCVLIGRCNDLTEFDGVFLCIIR